MGKLLYILSMIVLACAGYLFILSGIKLMGSNPGTRQFHVSIIDEFQTKGTIEKNDVQHVFPLVERAKEYALYLNPPQIADPEPIQPKTYIQPVYRPSNITPKFRLISTSYYISNPEKSVALVSEPGKGDHWIKKGEQVGNFVVEDITSGSIVYRNNNQLVAINVNAKQNIPISQPQEPITPTIAEVATETTLVKNMTTMEEIFDDNGNQNEEYVSPIRSVRQNSKKNVRPSLRLLYASQSDKN